MKFYHGTTEKFWKEIQKEGVLWGRKNVKWCGRFLSRVTWLALKKEHAGIYDDKGITNKKCVLLEVELDPVELFEVSNFHPDCWQVRTYDPILIDKIKKIN